MRDLRGITILETEKEIMEVAEGQPWLRRHFNQATKGATIEERAKGLANLMSALILRRNILLSEDLVVEILTRPGVFRMFTVAKKFSEIRAEMEAKKRANAKDQRKR
jgi:hypothetical protein